jgi:ADP-heptose:LPS heptosyltransferase
VYLLEKIAGHELRDSVLPDWPLQNAHSGKTSTYRDVKKRIVIHPGATVINRNWGSDKYAELINLCSNRHYQIDLIGGPGDEAKLQEITGMCKSEQPYTITTFEVLEEKIDLADCIVCNDSFMSHAAWAKKKAAVIIFGPANPHFFAPFSGPIRVAWNNLILTMPYELWTGPVPIASTDADTVMNAVEQLLAKEI